MVQESRAITTQRGGFHRPFGLWEFIAAYLNGKSTVDDIDFDPLQDKDRGAPQTDIRAEYNRTLTRQRAHEKARAKAADPERIEELTAAYAGELFKTEGIRRTVKRGSLSYHSFTVYFGMLRNMGWVEEVGSEPSVFQDINPGKTVSNDSPEMQVYRSTREHLTILGLPVDEAEALARRAAGIGSPSPERKLYRLTALGLANESVSNPKAVYGGAPAAPRQAPAPRPMPAPAPTPRPAAPVAPSPVRPVAPSPKPTTPAPAPKPLPAPRPAPPLPPPGFEADPKEVAALNAMLKSGLLTTRNFKEAVDLLTGGQARTAKDAADQAIRQKTAQTREKAGGTDLAALSDLWDAIILRVQGWKKPNSANAEKAMDRFVEEAVELGAVEDDVDAALSDVRSALAAYKNLDRSDFDSDEEYSEGKAEAWDAFTSSLDDVEFVKGEEEGEEE